MDFPYSGIFVSKKDYLIQTNAINKDFVALLKHFNKAVTQQHAQLLVVTYSIPSEIGENRDLAKTNKNNLKTLSASLRAQNIPCLCLMDLQENRFGAVAKNIYSYSHDGHFKPIGYSYMAQIIADSLSLSIVNP
jgi:hypothetical protein